MSASERPDPGANPARGPGRIPARAGGSLPFATSAVRLPMAMVAARPPVMAAALEDLCWSIAAADWIRREPVENAAERAAWSDEGSLLEAERVRIQALLFEVVTTW